MIRNCGVIVLAAGSSSRIGRPKQLLIYKGKSLLELALDAANNSEASPVIVVLGANAELFVKIAEQKKVHIAENRNWKEGMASSIRCGINAFIQLAPAADAVILMVCDQPYISGALLDELIVTQKNTGKQIVTSQYQHAIGPPAIFDKTIFPELLKLKGDTGARKIVEQHGPDVATVLFTQGDIDIDTEVDYKSLN